MVQWSLRAMDGMILYILQGGRGDSKKLLSSFLLNVQCTSLECVLEFRGFAGFSGNEMKKACEVRRLRRWMKETIVLKAPGWMALALDTENSVDTWELELHLRSQRICNCQLEIRCSSQVNLHTTDNWSMPA